MMHAEVNTLYTICNMAEGASSTTLVGSTGLVVIILELVLLYLPDVLNYHLGFRDPQNSHIPLVSSRHPRNRAPRAPNIFTQSPSSHRIRQFQMALKSKITFPSPEHLLLRSWNHQSAGGILRSPAKDRL